MSTVYGVTAAMVSELANGLLFTDAVVGPPAVAATRPSLATITGWITRHAKIVDNAIEAPGADPASIQANANSGGYAVASGVAAMPRRACCSTSRRCRHSRASACECCDET